MNTQPVLIRETSSPTELAKLAVDAVTRGDVDPLVAYENISRMEKAIELFKKSEEVRDITLRELAKYGHGKTSSDCTIEEVEAGVKYDYSGCNCQALDDLYKMRDAVMADIKEKEKILRALPASGLTDPATGEIFYPPARSSKTTLKVTFKKRKYISICVSELRQPDQYENTHCVFIRQSKEERERKDARTYVGRGKSVIFRPAEPTPDQVSDLPVADNTDDLPF